MTYDVKLKCARTKHAQEVAFSRHRIRLTDIEGDSGGQSATHSG